MLQKISPSKIVLFWVTIIEGRRRGGKGRRRSMDKAGELVSKTAISLNTSRGLP